jgi:hypothetical protein
VLAYLARYTHRVAIANRSRTLWIASKGFRLYPSSFPGLRLSQGLSMPRRSPPAGSESCAGGGARPIIVRHALAAALSVIVRYRCAQRPWQ